MRLGADITRRNPRRCAVCALPIISCAFCGVFACRCVSQEFLGGPEFCSLLGFGTPRLYLYPRTPECGCRHVFPCVHFYLDIRRSGAVICCNLTRLDAFLRLIIDCVWDFFARLLAAADIRAPICDTLVQARARVKCRYFYRRPS